VSLNYKAAYERQKQARAIAEDLLENRSRELYEANQSLQYAYNKLKNQKQQIVHQEKLASLGLLSAGVAHEINNPTGYVKSNLNTLKGYGQEINAFFAALDELMGSYSQSIEGGCGLEGQKIMSLLAQLKAKHDIQYLLADINNIVEESQEGIGRIESIVKGLRDFSRQEGSKEEVFDVVACLENTLRLVSTQIKSVLTVTFNKTSELYVNGQQGSLSQVFLNLIINASHAVLPHGHLEISALKNNNFAIITFKDNGCGIEKSVCAKIFEPFFTTKKQGQGTGLGLSISHSIVKNHGGLLSVESIEGQGAEFTVQLPLAYECLIN
jgi:signal transduction histidine kinase